jgi:hypothetical protein
MLNKNIDENTRQALFAIMYRLYHLDEEDIYSEKNYKTAHFQSSDLPWDDIKKSYLALKWAMENPDFDFKSISSGVSYTYDNKGICYFLKKKFEQYENLLKKNGMI